MNFKYLIKNKIKNFCLNFCNLERHVILAGYPKTGNTYLHYLINNLLNVRNKITPEFSYVSSYIKSPDLDMMPFYKVNSILNSFDNKPLLLKTHNHYHQSFQKVICLFRDPISTFSSLYNFESTFGKSSFKNFKSFLLNRDVINQYRSFYESYLNSKLSTRIVFVNYEDVINNPRVLKDIIYLIYGFNLDLNYIKEITNSCSKQKAIQLEKLYIKYDKRNKIKQRSFVNNKAFIDKPSQEDIRFIESKLSSLYEILNKE